MREPRNAKNICAFDRGTTCHALSGPRKPCACLGYECHIKKTPLELAMSKANANKKLASKPLSEQRYIANQYYDGRFPWLECMYNDG